jgi:dihydropyrimidine dehydrogenase (NAD+) subunit PreA
MHYGFGIIREMVSGLERYMDEHGFRTLNDFRGKALGNIMHWEDLNLKYKIVADIHEEKCIGCQLCYTACEDGAHQAIGLSADPANRTPFIIEENCVGCNLCSLVCPVEGCITMERRDDGKEVLTWKERTLDGNIPKKFNDDLAGGLHHWVPEPSEALEKELPRHYQAKSIS